jgi:SAM-dependent methyltransferase
VLDDVLPLLACPHCEGALARTAGTVRCPAGHSFDVARQGYLSLLPGGAGTADTADMVAARDRFLAGGAYRAIGDALAAAVREGPVVDVGAGTGAHLARVLADVDGPGLALDLSRHAAQRAARAHPRIGAVVADAWRALPVRSAVAGAVLSVFAPRGAAEAARVLTPGGRLVVVTPTPRHLAELVGPLGLVTVDPDKDVRLERQLAGFRLRSAEPVERALVLDAQQVRDVVAMGPSARHVGPDGVGAAAATRLAGEVTLSVRVAVYEPR